MKLSQLTPVLAGVLVLALGAGAVAAEGRYEYPRPASLDQPPKIEQPAVTADSERARILRSQGAVIPLLNNPGFETNGGAGTNVLNGWTNFTNNFFAGDWFAQTGALSPVNGIAVAPPPEGSFAAMSDQDGPGTRIIYQDFVVPTGRTTLICDVYVNNAFGVFINAGDLNPDAAVAPNQHARVDLMDPTAPVDDTGAGVLRNYFITNPGFQNPFGYSPVVMDISDFAGQSVRLRFAEVDNQLFFNMGVDDCLAVELTSVPTLGQAGLAGLVLLLAGLAVYLLRRS